MVYPGPALRPHGRVAVRAPVCCMRWLGVTTRAEARPDQHKPHGGAGPPRPRRDRTSLFDRGLELADAQHAPVGPIVDAAEADEQACDDEHQPDNGEWSHGRAPQVVYA